MKKIEFNTDIVIPDGGWVVIMHNKKMYENRGSESFYECGRGTFSTDAKSESDLKGGQIYHFPDPYDAYCMLKNGGCLDRFLLKPDKTNNTAIRNEILRRLKSNELIGFVNGKYPDKYRARLNKETIGWESIAHPDYRDNGEICSNIEEKIWYEFAHEIEIYKWMINYST